MIRKISKLENICSFSSLTHEKDFIYGDIDNCNIIFGFNGTGKTTLANAISFFGNNLFISEEEKKSLYDDIKNGETAAIELELRGESIIKHIALTLIKH